MDQYIQSQLLVAALNITVKVLKKGGNFVAKIFKGSEIGFLYSQFKLYFREIHIFKYLIIDLGRIAAARVALNTFWLESTIINMHNLKKLNFLLF